MVCLILLPFLVVASSLSSLGLYHAIPFWLVEFLLRNQLITLWDFPLMLFFLFPCCFWYLTFVFNFCQFDCSVSQCVSPWFTRLVLSVPPGHGWLFLFSCWEGFQLLSFQIFSWVLSLFLPFWNPYYENIGVVNVVPEVS